MRSELPPYSYSKMPVTLALGLLLGLGGFGCGEEAKTGPLITVDSPASDTSIRVCPKCYRRFFGGQAHCTVDGTGLVDYQSPEDGVAHEGHEDAPEAVPVAQPVAELAKVEDSEGQNKQIQGQRPSTKSAGTTSPNNPASSEPVKSVSVVRDTRNNGQYEPAPEPATQVKAVASVPKTKAVASPAYQKAAVKQGTPVVKTPRPTPLPTAVPTEVPVVATLVPSTPMPTAVATPEPKPVATAVPERLATPVPKVVATPMPEKVANLPPPQSVEEILSELWADESRLANLSSSGKLSPDQVGALVSVGGESEDLFTKSRTYLIMFYKATGNDSQYASSLKELLSIPSNAYNPTIRLEQSEYLLNAKRYDEAIEAAGVAERYRQKFPRGEIYYVRLARTYEILAKSYEGRFTGSEDPDDLDQAIRIWQRYLTHVERKSDNKRKSMAENNISKLERIKERVL